MNIFGRNRLKQAMASGNQHELRGAIDDVLVGENPKQEDLDLLGKAFGTVDLTEYKLSKVGAAPGLQIPFTEEEMEKCFGYVEYVDPEDWEDMLAASFESEVL